MEGSSAMGSFTLVLCLVCTFSAIQSRLKFEEYVESSISLILTQLDSSQVLLHPLQVSLKSILVIFKSIWRFCLPGHYIVDISLVDITPLPPLCGRVYFSFEGPYFPRQVRLSVIAIPELPNSSWPLRLNISIDHISNTFCRPEAFKINYLFKSSIHREDQMWVCGTSYQELVLTDSTAFLFTWLTSAKESHAVELWMEYELINEALTLVGKEYPHEGLSKTTFFYDEFKTHGYVWEYVTHPGLLPVVSIQNLNCSLHQLKIYDGPVSRCPLKQIECLTEHRDIEQHGSGRHLLIEIYPTGLGLHNLKIDFSSHRLKCIKESIGKSFPMLYNRTMSGTFYHGWHFTNVDPDNYLRLLIHNFSYNGHQKQECQYAGLYFQPLLDFFNFSITVCHDPYTHPEPWMTREIAVGSVTNSLAMYALRYHNLGTLYFNISVETETCQTIMNICAFADFMATNSDREIFTDLTQGLELVIDE